MLLTVDDGDLDGVGPVGDGLGAGVVARVLGDGALDAQHAQHVVSLPHRLHPEQNRYDQQSSIQILLLIILNGHAKVRLMFRYEY